MGIITRSMTRSSAQSDEVQHSYSHTHIPQFFMDDSSYTQYLKDGRIEGPQGNPEPTPLPLDHVSEHTSGVLIQRAEATRRDELESLTLQTTSTTKSFRASATSDACDYTSSTSMSSESSTSAHSDVPRRLVRERTSTPFYPANEYNWPEDSTEQISHRKPEITIRNSRFSSSTISAAFFDDSTHFQTALMQGYFPSRVPSKIASSTQSKYDDSWESIYYEPENLSSSRMTRSSRYDTPRPSSPRTPGAPRIIKVGRYAVTPCRGSVTFVERNARVVAQCVPLQERHYGRRTNMQVNEYSVSAGRRLHSEIARQARIEGDAVETADASGFDPAHFTRAQAIARAALKRKFGDTTRSVYAPLDDETEHINCHPSRATAGRALRREETLDDVDGTDEEILRHRSVSVASTVVVDAFGRGQDPSVFHDDECVSEFLRADGRGGDEWAIDAVELIMHD